MKRFFNTILAATLLFISENSDSLADEKLSQTELAARIIELNKFDIKTSRHDATLTECSLVSRRRDLFREGEEPPEAGQLNLDNANILMGVVYIDLRTVTIDVPPGYEHMLKPLSETAPAIFVLKPGSSILFSAFDEDALALLPFTAPPENPIIREEAVHRSRTIAAIKRGETRPSDRGDGESFVFRDDDVVTFTAERPDQIDQLEELEKALLEYQDRFCRNLS